MIPVDQDTAWQIILGFLVGGFPVHVVIGVILWDFLSERRAALYLFLAVPVVAAVIAFATLSLFWFAAGLFLVLGSLSLNLWLWSRRRERSEAWWRERRRIRRKTEKPPTAKTRRILGKPDSRFGTYGPESTRHIMLRHKARGSRIKIMD